MDSMGISTHKSKEKAQKKLETELMLAVVTRAESPGLGGAESPARPEYPVSVGRSLWSWGRVSGLPDQSLRPKTDLTHGDSILSTTDDIDAGTSFYCR